MTSYTMMFADTVLRVPTLFVMDEVLKLSCGFSSLRYASYDKNIVTSSDFLGGDLEELHSENLDSNEASWESYENNTGSDWHTTELTDSDLHRLSLIPTLGKVLCCIIALLAANMIFLLSWNRLVKVYTFLLSLSIIIFSYQTNMTTVKFVTSMENSSRPALLQSFLSLNSSALWDSGGNYFSLAYNYIIQALLGIIFTTLIPVFHQPTMKVLITFSFITPTFALLLPLPQDVKLSVPVFTALLPLGILKFVFVSNLFNFVLVIVRGYQYARRVLNNYGLHSLLENEWERLNVPTVLRTFWLVRTAQHLCLLLCEYMMERGDINSLITIDADDAFDIFRELMIYGCETSVALLGMTSVVSYIGHHVGALVQMLLQAEDDDERSMGTVCAVLFFVLAEQSGITVLEGEKRFIRLCRNFSFLFTAMLHFTHNMVNPVLMSLSASRNPVTHRHARALLVSALLLVLPCLLVSLLWQRYPVSTWLLAVSAFSVQVVVKTLVSLLIYSLFLIDACRNNFWESLDDYVYYIRAFGNSVEFVFGILLFFTGAWIYFFESGGSIRATMMCIHAYFNIWCEAKNGWSVFMKRRTAVNKINSLPEATQADLDKHSDVCAICFQDLHTAKVTKCKHLFHSICLRKWLYVQDSCPLCHETLYKNEQPMNADEEETAAQPAGANEPPPDAPNSVEEIPPSVVQTENQPTNVLQATASGDSSISDCVNNTEASSSSLENEKVETSEPSSPEESTARLRQTAKVT